LNYRIFLKILTLIIELDNTCDTRNVQIVNQKLLLRVTRNDQIKNKNSCTKFVSNIETNFGWTYGKIEVNASIEHINWVGGMSLIPKNHTYGPGKRSGYLDLFVSDKLYLRQRRHELYCGIHYGDNFN